MARAGGVEWRLGRKEGEAGAGEAERSVWG